MIPPKSLTDPSVLAATAAPTSIPAATLRTPGSRKFKPKAGFSPAGIAVMVAAHGLLGYALVSGMAGKAIEIVKKPLSATIIAEVNLPPPPPPPPPPPKIEKIQKAEAAPKIAPPPAYVPPPDVAPPVTTAPAITAVQGMLPQAPPPAAPPAPPEPVAPTPPAPTRADIGLVCPKQVKPETPKKAIEDGIEGTVKTEVRVRGGKVVDVRIISGPRAYHGAVRAALARYECNTTGSDAEVVSTQDFNFKLE